MEATDAMTIEVGLGEDFVDGRAHGRGYDAPANDVSGLGKLRVDNSNAIDLIGEGH